MSSIPAGAVRLNRAELTIPDAHINVRGHIAALDGLRGVAILLVLFHHLWPWVWSHPLVSGVTRLSHISWIGVDLFFVLSGFLITGILLDSRAQPGYLKRFFARRSLRIFPLYYLFLTICFFVLPWVLDGAGKQVPEVSNPMWFWLYGSNYIWSTQNSNPPEYLGITWSLALEEQFYLVWPFIVLVFYRNLKLAITFAIASAVAVRIWFIFSVDAWADATYMASISRVDTLLMGAAIALYARSESFRWDWWNGAARIALFVCLPLVIVWQLLYPGRSTAWFSAFGYTLLAMGLAGIMMHALSNDDSLLKRIMNLEVLQWFGRYSYGIYLYHMLIWWLSHQWLNAEVMADGTPLHPEHFSPLGSSLLMDAIVRFMVCAGVTLMTAWASFHLFEKQFLKLKRFY